MAVVFVVVGIYLSVSIDEGHDVQALLTPLTGSNPSTPCLYLAFKTISAASSHSWGRHQIDCKHITWCISVCVSTKKCALPQVVGDSVLHLVQGWPLETESQLYTLRQEQLKNSDCKVLRCYNHADERIRMPTETCTWQQHQLASLLQHQMWNTLGVVVINILTHHRHTTMSLFACLTFLLHLHKTQNTFHGYISRHIDWTTKLRHHAWVSQNMGHLSHQLSWLNNNKTQTPRWSQSKHVTPFMHIEYMLLAPIFYRQISALGGGGEHPYFIDQSVLGRGGSSECASHHILWTHSTLYTLQSFHVHVWSKYT